MSVPSAEFSSESGKRAITSLVALTMDVTFWLPADWVR
jgi:hypothetical protein